MQKKRSTFSRLLLVAGFSVLLVTSMLGFIPSRTASVQLTTSFSGFGGISGSNPNWVFAGAFLNYSATSNWNGKIALSNGSSLSIVGNLTGSLKIVANSISNQTGIFGGTQEVANVTTVPNFAFKDKITYFNGTAQSTDLVEGAANASSSVIPLAELNFGNVLQNELNTTNQLYSFSPTLNASLSKSPGVLYQFNSTTSVPAIHITTSVAEQAALPSYLSSTMTGSYSINGSSDIYISIAHDIPLKETLSLKGSTSVQNAQIGLNTQSASANGNFAATVTLLATNINLSLGNNIQQSTISVPNYSTSLDVISNSTITSASTSGNQLVVNVTGPSGTAGVLDVVVSPSLLSSAGITSVSQVAVTVDGQAYSDYSVTNIGGSYDFIIYYHHSSHKVAMSFGSANLGTNQGTVSSLTGQGSSLLSNATIIEIASVVVVIVVIALVFTFLRRSKKSGESAPAQGPAQA